MDDKEKGKRIRAYYLGRQAIKSGKIKKQPCEICGSKYAGWHHPNYNYPLRIRWLCYNHHDEAHAKYRRFQKGKELAHILRNENLWNKPVMTSWMVHRYLNKRMEWVYINQITLKGKYSYKKQCYLYRLNDINAFKDKRGIPSMEFPQIRRKGKPLIGG